jgi:hypothetical protein
MATLRRQSGQKEGGANAVHQSSGWRLASKIEMIS